MAHSGSWGQDWWLGNRLTYGYVVPAVVLWGDMLLATSVGQDAALSMSSSGIAPTCPALHSSRQRVIARVYPAQCGHLDLFTP